MRRNEGGGAVWIVALAALTVGLVVWAWAGGHSGYQRYKRPACEWCGKGEYPGHLLEVHHNLPQHVAPALINEPTNLVTLGDPGCHLTLGHYRDYQRGWNPNCIDIVKAYGKAPWTNDPYTVTNP